MPAPFEIIGAPATVWVAAVGTAFPDVSAAPGGSWTKLGNAGDYNYHEDGVMITHAQDIEYIRALGATAPVKAIRKGEDVTISFKVMDLTMEAYLHAMNGASITTVAAGSGTGGYKSIPMKRGIDVTQKAMLIRGPSPYIVSANLDYQIPRIVHVGDPEVAFKKDGAAVLLMEWRLIEDPDFAGGRHGQILAQHQAAA